MAKGTLTMDDFLAQLKSIRKMGSMKSLLGMLPGIGQQLQGWTWTRSRSTARRRSSSR
jgi:signal recognition particle GTPase